MTIGPEPMIRMRWRSFAAASVSACSPSSHDKIVEQIVRIVRAGRGFGMILHAEHRLAAMTEAFERLVVQIDVRDFDIVER